MRNTNDWKDYELLDSSDGERLERWGDIILIRPDPQVIWKTPKKHPLWRKADARYHRSSKGGGQWEVYKNFPEEWNISYRDLTFKIKPMGFKHTGLFPEQAVNWDYLRDVIQTSGRDCLKFVQREIRRGNKYDIIIMDPPSYGRGPGGEVWKLEEKIYEFVSTCEQVLSDDPLMVLINSYTTGLSPSVMQYILGSVIVPGHGGSVTCDEIGLPTTQTGMCLPCGASAIWRND